MLLARWPHIGDVNEKFDMQLKWLLRSWLGLEVRSSSAVSWVAVPCLCCCLGPRSPIVSIKVAAVQWRRSPHREKITYLLDFIIPPTLLTAPRHRSSMSFFAAASRAEVRACGLPLGGCCCCLWFDELVHLCLEIGGENLVVFIIFADTVLRNPVVPATRGSSSD